MPNYLLNTWQIPILPMDLQMLFSILKSFRSLPMMINPIVHQDHLNNMHHPPSSKTKVSPSYPRSLLVEGSSHGIMLVAYAHELQPEQTNCAAGITVHTGH